MFMMAGALYIRYSTTMTLQASATIYIFTKPNKQIHEEEKTKQTHTKTFDFPTSFPAILVYKVDHVVTNIRNFLLVLVLVQEYQKSLQNIPSSSPGSSARWQGLNNPAAPSGPRRLSPEPLRATFCCRSARLNLCI